MVPFKTKLQCSIYLVIAAFLVASFANASDPITLVEEGIRPSEHKDLENDKINQLNAMKDIVQSGGEKIEKVEITVNPIFDENNPKENYWIFRLANKLHPLTRKRVVADDLFFKQGDDFDQDLIDASERLLNTRRYLAKSSIVVENDANKEAIAKVNVRDVWTLKPQFSVSRSGGDNKYSYGIEDTNFLGTGKGITISRYGNAERSGSVFEYYDPNTGAYNSRFIVKYADNEDGKLVETSLIRPFLDFSTEWAGGLAFKDLTGDKILYSGGETVEQFGHMETESSIFYGRQIGISYDVNGERTVSRILSGFTRENNEFFIHDDKLSDPIFNIGELPEARQFDTAWIEYQRVDDGYIKTTNTQQINRAEYINLGQQLRFRFGLYNNGVADGTYGDSTHGDSTYGDRGYLFQSEYSFGALLPVRDLFLTSFSLDGKYSENGLLFDTTFSASASYYWRNMERGQMLVKLEGTKGFNLYKDTPLELGGDTGLRGFPSHYQAGDRRLFLNVEQHFFGKKEWFSLFHAGFAVFFDVGRAWGSTDIAQIDDGLLKDVGVGIRLSGTRTGNREEGAHNILHVDLVRPIGTYPGDVSGLQVRVGVEKHF